MDYLKDLHEMCETLSRELGEANEKVRQSGGSLNGSDLDYIDKLTHAIKSIKTTIAMIESEDGESGMYPYYRSFAQNGNQGSYRRGSYNQGSYARRRDSMGRYSSRGYSRDDDMIAELRDLMNEAPDDKMKQEFQRFIDKIERM